MPIGMARRGLARSGDSRRAQRVGGGAATAGGSAGEVRRGPAGSTSGDGRMRRARCKRWGLNDKARRRRGGGTWFG
jgi:hypothetical protein